MDPTYRNYLQSLANNGDQSANLLLDVVGDDGNVNGDFLGGNSDIVKNGLTLSKANVPGVNADYYNAYKGQSRLGASTSTPNNLSTGGTTANPAQDIAFLNDQEAQLRALLGRTDTGLSQGLTQNEDQYQTQLGGANADKQRQYANYQDQRTKTNQDKLGAYNTIDRNAGQGYNSLAQLIGRAAGTGSSAFRDLLPNAVGKDTSSKRLQATDTYGQNLQGIDKAQGQYDISFEGVLADLLKQKKANEEALRTGIETQRQGINQQLSQNAGARAQAAGGGYDQVKAAQTPYQQAIDNSRNAVEGFFSQFRTPYTPTQAVAATPDLANYNVDRSVVNAQNQGAADPNNPYASLLRKKLQEQSTGA